MDFNITQSEYVPGSYAFGCDCGERSPYNEDCYFYEEEHDMGARIPCCSFGDGFNPISQCPYGCKHYLKNSDVYKLVMEQLKKKEETE